MSGLSPEEAAAALAWRLGLTPAQTEILAQLLSPAGYIVAAGGGTPGKSHKVQICKMRATLAAAGFDGVILTRAAAGYIDRSRGPDAEALRYETSPDGRAALFRLAEALPAAAAPDPRTKSPPGLTLTPSMAVLHHALVAAGAAGRLCSRAHLLGQLSAVSGRPRQPDNVDVQLCHLRKRVARAGLVIERRYSQGWRYRPDTLAAYLAANPAGAPAPHLSPIKKEGPSR